MKNYCYISLFLICFASCSDKKPIAEVQNISAELPVKDSLVKVKEIPVVKTLAEANNDVILYLKEKNYKAIGDYIHPKKGVLFSTYLYIQPKTDQHFTKEQYLDNLTSGKDFIWGLQDGTGEIYKTTLNKYLENWVFQRDFSESTLAENKIEKKGNSINNIKEIFPESQFTVNHLEGTAEFSKMDWQNLILVFEEFEGKKYLVAILNDQWTT